MKSPFDDLVAKRNELIDADITEEESDKLRGACYPGCKVRIYWNESVIGTVFYDEGYVFVGEGMDADLGDCFVYIPRPDNSGGIGDAPPEFRYMLDLMQNHLVTKIICR